MEDPIETKYLVFELITGTEKTNTWQIMSKRTRGYLGIVQWYGPWRQYCFYPGSSTVWNIDCLQDIQNFIRTEMDKRKK